MAWSYPDGVTESGTSFRLAAAGDYSGGVDAAQFRNRTGAVQKLDSDRPGR